MLRAVNIGCVGDSLTEGGYPRVLQDLLNAREPSCQWILHNMGVPGSNTKEWADTILPSRSHYPSGMATGGIDLYLVMLGTNDAQLRRWSSEQSFSDRLSRIGKALLEEGAAVMIISPPPVEPGGSFTQHFDAAILNSVIPRIVPQVAASIGCGHADAFSALGGLNPKHEAFIDGVHLSKEGNKLIANAMVNEVHQMVMGRARGNALPGHALVAPAPGMLAKTQAGLALSVSPNAQVSATPRLKQPQADGYCVGAAVEIFSNSWDRWFVGRCTKLEGATILAEFVAPDGKTKEKRMDPSHPEVRLCKGGSPVLQAAPICTSTARSSTLCTSQVGATSRSSILRASPVTGGLVGCLASPVKTSVGPLSPMNVVAKGVVLNAAAGVKRSSIPSPILSAANGIKSHHSQPIMVGQAGFMLPASVDSLYKRHCGYTESALVSVR